jgi:nucleotide-binding universal stress UspA family protein
MYQNILIATDGSELAGKGVAQGLSLAQAVGAKVTAVVVELPFNGLVFGECEPDRVAEIAARVTKDEKEHAGRILKDVAAAAKKCGVACDTIQVENPKPYEGILQVADDKKCDLIVMGSHGRGGVSGLLIGSVTNRLIAHTKLPVLVCH